MLKEWIPTLRPATPGDTDALCAIYASTRAEELAQAPWTEAQKTAFCQAQFAAQDAYYRQHYPTAEFWIIERERELAGRLYLDRWDREIRIMDLALLPQHRGGGAGTHLLRQVQAEAATAAKSLTIHVENFNPARRLYERLGFRVVEDKGVYSLMEWRPA